MGSLTLGPPAGPAWVDHHRSCNKWSTPHLFFTHGPQRWNHGSTDVLFLLLLLLLLLYTTNIWMGSCDPCTLVCKNWGSQGLELTLQDCQTCLLTIFAIDDTLK